jgi:hypothetical protein
VQPDSFIVSGCGDHALRQLAAVLTGLRQRGFVFCTARQIAKTWDNVQGQDLPNV